MDQDITELLDKSLFGSVGFTKVGFKSSEGEGQSMANQRLRHPGTAYTLGLHEAGYCPETGGTQSSQHEHNV